MIEIEGTLKPDGTLELDSKPELPPGRVRVTLARVPEPLGEGFFERLAAMHRAQRERGFVPRSEQEVEAEREATRDDWDERMDSLERERMRPPDRDRPETDEGSDR